MFDDDIDYTKIMFGCDAVKMPINLIVQKVGNDGKISGVFQSSFQNPHPLMFGSCLTHQLIIGDGVIRPHIVIDSDHLRGSGFNGLGRDGFLIDSWISNGNVLINKGS